MDVILFKIERHTNVPQQDSMPPRGPAVLRDTCMYVIMMMLICIVFYIHVHPSGGVLR